MPIRNSSRFRFTRTNDIEPFSLKVFMGHRAIVFSKHNRKPVYLDVLARIQYFLRRRSKGGSRYNVFPSVFSV